MQREYFKNSNIWSGLSKLTLLSLSILLIVRWPSLPRFLDIYYHLHTAWGFIQAGGYSSWDFWEYAPFGRPHIYPPLFQIILAWLIKSGMSVVFLAKFFESTTPILFLIIFWNFIRKYYGEQLGFFVAVAVSSSFIFLVSLSNHLPSTLALILGFLSLGEFLKKKVWRAIILLILCFYTHLSVPWFFVLSYIFYAAMDKDSRKDSFKVILVSLLLALPILIPEFLKLHFIRLAGNQASGQFYLQAKVFNYILAGFGLWLAIKAKLRYRLFMSLFLASLIFLAYPYRFLASEGYIPVIIFSALALQAIWHWLKVKMPRVKKVFMAALIGFMLFVSPTLFMNKPAGESKIDYKIDWVDSAFSSMFYAKGDSLWYPWAYLPVVDTIKANSDRGDIIYSDINSVGLTLGSLSQRSTVNGMFAEVKPLARMDPFVVAKIIVLANDLDAGIVNSIVQKYHLLKINENKYFTVFKNPESISKLKIRKAIVSFWVIAVILFIFAGLFCWKKR